MISVPRLSQIFGVRLRLHYTWLVGVVLIAAAVITQFSMEYPWWQRAILGVCASLIFLAAITLREFALGLMAISKGVALKRVTLFVFGGVPEIAEDSTRPAIELLLAVAGIVCNLIIAGIFYAAYLVLARTGSIIVDVLVQWLAFISFMLFLFHLIPGFPLDGGKAMRALLWMASGNYERVTLIASWLGWSVGLLFAIVGIVLLITTQQWFVGIILVFPGLVLQNAATRSRRQVT